MTSPFAVTKAADEQRYTLSPIYAPGVLDAHNEWATADTLQKGLWGLMRSPKGREIHLQHRRNVVAGELVEGCAWPYPVTCTLSTPGGVDKAATRETTFPAGTLFAGVVWRDWAWRLIKTGALQGLSMGGSARRVRGVEADFDREQVAKALAEEDLDGPAATAKALVSKAAADPSRHPFVAADTGRCLFCAHSRVFHDSVDKARARPHNRTSLYQPPLQITDAASLLAALEKLPTLRDPAEGRRQISLAAARLGLVPLLQSALEAARAKAQQAQALASRQAEETAAVAAKLGVGVGATPAAPAPAPAREQAPQRTPSGYLPRTPRQRGRGRPGSWPGGPAEREPGPKSAPGSGVSPAGNTSNAGSGEPVARPARSTPKRLAKEHPSVAYGIDDMALLARTDEDRALIKKARAMAAKATPLTPEPDFPVPTPQLGDWTRVSPELYERYRRGEVGFEAVAKSVAEGSSASAADVGQAWLDALNDPSQAARAGADYEAGFRGLDTDDLDE